MAVKYALAAVIGVVAGFLSGLLGIGGAVILIPGMVYVLGFDQRMAQGTSLAVLALPVVLAGALEYYRQGFVDLRTAAVLVLSFPLGSLLGGMLAVKTSPQLLKKIFAIFLIVVALKMLFD